jgi:hypothetical protein
MKQRWDIQEIVATLEEQAEVHREREAHHAELGALHEELRSRHAAELGAITKRLEVFQAAAAEAVELAGRKRSGSAAVEEDFGPPSNPKLTRMVKSVLAEIGPHEPFGPNGVLAEIESRFGDKIRTRLDLRQISDILRRLKRTGHIHRLRAGRPHHESRYTRQRPER